MKLKFSDSWKGFCLCGYGIENFSPEKLTDNFVKTFKSGKTGVVGLKRLKFKGSKVEVVVKSHVRSKKAADFVRSFDTSRAMKSFKLSAKLESEGIAVAKPLAAIEKRVGLFCAESIFVTEYIENSMSLYDIAFNKDEYAVANWSIVKKQIIKSTAELLGLMHNKNYWHRDSKAGNFLVCRNDDNSYSVRLIDVDGIKKYGLDRDVRKAQTLWKLAETLSRFTRVSIVDLWRGFKIYCELTGIAKNDQRTIFYELQKMMIAKKLLTVVGDAYKKI